MRGKEACDMKIFAVTTTTTTTEKKEIFLKFHILYNQKKSWLHQLLLCVTVTA